MSREPQQGGGDLTREWRDEIERLVRSGPRERGSLVRILDRGDWRARVLAASALGRLVRHEATAAGRSMTGTWLSRVPFLRRHAHSMGDHGRLVSRSLLQATGDRLFIVRTAATLALGECRDPALTPRLSALLTDPIRPVRIAAAAALRASSGPGAAAASVAQAAEATPALMAEGVPTLEWLQSLADAHEALLGDSLADLNGPAGAAAADVAAWLAGPLAVLGEGGASAEAMRYDEEVSLAYQLAKPFGAHDRADNLRQLDAFVALVSHMDLPRGARVLDLGGGSGWAGELLARFGFTAIVVDVAVPLLRLASERFNRAGLRGHIVAADMMSLPLCTGSVDAVIAIDALHHVKGLDAVFSEVRRVLAPGGRFLLAEPGEGHAESSKSLAESREHGVREGEVHPVAAAALAKRAGFDQARVIPRVPSQTWMDPSELRSAVTTRPGTWRVTTEGAETPFDTLVLRNMLARPLMVFTAGERRIDTRAPGRLGADIQPSLARTGRRISGFVDLRNTGDTVWLDETADGTGAVSLGVQLLDAEGRLLDRDFRRVRLPHPVAPDASCRVAMDIALPESAARWRAKLDLVAERICWFEDRGSRSVQIEL